MLLPVRMTSLPAVHQGMNVVVTIDPKNAARGAESKGIGYKTIDTVQV
jgi:hypothetical protein